MTLSLALTLLAWLTWAVVSLGYLAHYVHQHEADHDGEVEVPERAAWLA